MKSGDWIVSNLHQHFVESTEKLLQAISQHALTEKLLDDSKTNLHLDSNKIMENNGK